MIPMQRIKLIVEYDGSNYHGFQKQLNAHTIQAELEQAIHTISGETAGVNAAGRTDAGVHALGQVAAFNTATGIPAEKWKLALNSCLPDDIRIMNSQLVSMVFNPQFDAVQKSYRYLIYRKKEGATFYRNYALLNDQTLDIKAMQFSCSLVIGKHDFRCFCASGSGVKTWERTVHICSLEAEDAWLKLNIAADGFLYNMVRIIIGTLLEVGRGRFQAEQITSIIASRERSQAGPTAPPQGLYLCSVEYPIGCI
jgi:tRNA pseudouridine38-40 synthase